MISRIIATIAHLCAVCHRRARRDGATTCGFCAERP